MSCRSARDGVNKAYKFGVEFSGQSDRHTGPCPLHQLQPPALPFQLFHLPVSRRSEAHLPANSPSTVATCPPAAAKCSAVHWSVSLAFLSAPAASKASRHSSQLARQAARKALVATCRDVQHSTVSDIDKFEGELLKCKMSNQALHLTHPSIIAHGCFFYDSATQANANARH